MYLKKLDRLEKFYPFDKNLDYCVDGILVVLTKIDYNKRMHKRISERSSTRNSLPSGFLNGDLLKNQFDLMK